MKTSRLLGWIPALVLILTFAPAWAEPDPPPVPSGDEVAPSEPGRGPEYAGEAAFVYLPDITVVYPAGPGEPVDANRRSATWRARWLTANFKNKVQVVGDDQVTEEQRQGNLLVLGWRNRLMRAAGLAPVFTHDATGTDFLGIKTDDPELDLLVFHRSPFNWESFMVFWSSIDPERDRFQPLPRVGSDWAIFKDYQPVRQGMFKPGRVWPPIRNLNAEVDHTHGLLAPPDSRGTAESRHYHLDYDRSKIPGEEIKPILDAREAGLAKAVAALGKVPEGFKIYLYVYDDEVAKRDATGVADPTHSVPSGGDLFMTRRYARSTSPHEEVHLIARIVYGPCFSTAIYEGLALSVETTWKGDGMAMHAANLKRQGKLPGPGALLDEVKFRALPDDVGLPAAGAFMTFLRETYGPEGLKKIYSWDDERVSTFAAALGTTESELAAGFAAWADLQAVALKRNLDFLEAEKDARAKQLAGDWVGMVAALRRALVARPGDAQSMFNLASAQMRADDLSGAEMTLRNVLALPATPDGTRFVIFGHYQLGRVYDLQGRRKDALAEYDAVLKLPDEHGAHELARERKASPATWAHLE